MFFDFLQLSGVLLVCILQMLECATWVNIVTWVDAHLFAIQCSHIGSMGSKMHIGHQWGIVSISLQLGRDVLHILSLASALSGEAYQLATSVDDALGLSHTPLCIIGIYRTHRLDADRILSTYADTSHAGFG